MVEHTLWEGLATSVGTKVCCETWEQTKRSLFHNFKYLMGKSGTNKEDDICFPLSSENGFQYHIGMAAIKMSMSTNTHRSNMISSNA